MHIYFQFTIDFREFKLNFYLPISLSIHYLYREFTTNQFRSSPNYNEFTIYSTNSKRRFHYYSRDFTFNSLFFRELISNWLYFSRIHAEYTIFFKNSLSIHYLDRKFTKNSRFSFFVNSLWIHFLFQNFTTNSFPVSRNQFEFTIFVANSLRIHYYFANSLSRHNS